MNWQRFKDYYLDIPHLNMAIDISHVNFPDDFLAKMETPMQQAFAAMQELEAGAIANPDEQRRVGHYWLRDAAMAPDETTRTAITTTLQRIHALTQRIHAGELSGAQGPFKHLLIVGIGGSALGPQFVSQALGDPSTDKLTAHFFDNTDPDGMDLVLKQLTGQLGQTLTIVISKSGGTPETRNGMLEATAAYQRAGLSFAEHAIAITGEGSKLEQHAQTEQWLDIFPMWDWVGGRTSELAAVGLLPAALQGIDINSMLAGAREMDQETREKTTRHNPAALLALMWHFLTDGRGAKDMVVLPYKDRLALFSRYLQQLVMESLGKEYDLQGNVVNQGIAVYGNKGSTDQHAYVQQLREGVANFFVTFIEVHRERFGPSIEVEPGTTAGEFLQGFMLGTRDALLEKGRQSITITIERVSPHNVGRLIALYERAVGYYGSLVNINAYHQPGVEAGKKAAAGVLALKNRIRDHLVGQAGQLFTAASLATVLQCESETALVFKLLEHMAANPEKGVQKTAAMPFYNATFTFSG